MTRLDLNQCGMIVKNYIYKNYNAITLTVNKEEVLSVIFQYNLLVLNLRVMILKNYVGLLSDVIYEFCIHYQMVTKILRQLHHDVVTAKYNHQSE